MTKNPETEDVSEDRKHGNCFCGPAQKRPVLLGVVRVKSSSRWMQDLLHLVEEGKDSRQTKRILLPREYVVG